MRVDLVIIGAGPAGLAAAVEAHREGISDILLIERDRETGGILNQCIHNGFGIHIYKEELTGPEYAARAFDELFGTSVVVKTDTMVLSVTPYPGADHDRQTESTGDARVMERTAPTGPDTSTGTPPAHRVVAMNRTDGILTIDCGAVILAMGCRERTRGAISIPGSRPAGVLTAGAAQRYVNIEGCMVGKRVVLLGSGDIGLIMARRMTLEGARVLACVELMPFSGGLNRNIVQCLQDYDIPLMLSHTVTDIRGRKRLEAVTISRVDEALRPIPGTETGIECDTLLLSVGLIPENELSKGAGVELDPRTGGPLVRNDTLTSVPGIFACGNVLHVHDLVDNVTLEARKAGRAAARFLRETAVREENKTILPPTASSSGTVLSLTAGEDIGYTVPQAFVTPLPDKTADIYFRVRKILRDYEILLCDEAGNVLRRAVRDYMAPGEMEKIVVPASLLDGLSTQTLTLTLRSREEAAHD
ncbi:MAG: FAD-dependent oxidoreductase [Clostridiaceae bacterium]|jgi:NADPH-dependent 2,4-dienoyl-CoA reductase/sulfur reductase-like enzyme|nr:FAD-dependent oxidoreductase [Clostridiaceae bacterium]